MSAGDTAKRVLAADRLGQLLCIGLVGDLLDTIGDDDVRDGLQAVASRLRLIVATEGASEVERT